MSEIDTVLVRKSVMETLAKLDELKHSIDVLQAQIRSDFERKMELFRFSQVRKEFLEPFFEEPYVIIPKRANEGYVIAPKWLDFQIGWLERSTKLCAGLDLGKYQDYSVLAVVKVEESSIKLIHMHQFPLRTPYASVIGYVKTICDRWQTINKVYVDMSGVGDYIVEDMVNAGISEAEGVKFTQETKENMAQWLKQCMVNKTLKIPYDSDLIAELNIERFELTKEGKIKFSHPEGTHDDRFWSLALAVAATRQEAEGKPDSFIFF